LNVYKNLIILILLSLVTALLLYEGMKKVSFKPSLLPQEQELVSLSVERVDVQRRESDVVPRRQAPFGGPSEHKKEFPAVPLPQVLGQSSSPKKSVSLIMIKDGQRIAIVDSKVVREGDVTGKSRVLKIETGRILLREDGTDRWFPLNQATDQSGSKARGESKLAGDSGAERSKADPGRGKTEEAAKAEKNRTLKQVEETKK
jgi:hypothetical protein